MKQPLPSEEELVRLARHAAKVASAFYRTHDYEEDLVQEIFAQMPNITQTWRPEAGSFDAYLYGVAKNLLKGMIRDSALYQLEDDPSALEAFEDPFHTPELEATVDIAKAIEHVEAKLAAANLTVEHIAPEPRRNPTPVKAERADCTALRAMISRTGMTKAAVARAIGISPQLLNAYITGRTRKVPRYVIEAVMDLVETRSAPTPAQTEHP